jgi:hypothetical protein
LRVADGLEWPTGSSPSLGTNPQQPPGDAQQPLPNKQAHTLLATAGAIAVPGERAGAVAVGMALFDPKQSLNLAAQAALAWTTASKPWTGFVSMWYGDAGFWARQMA